MKVYNYLYKLVLVLILLSLFASCKKTNYVLYDQKYNGIYFLRQSIVDTIPTAYLAYTDTDTIIPINLLAVGIISDSSRKFNITSVSEDSNSAISDNDYTMSGDYAIAANKTSDSLLIHIKNYFLKSDCRDKYITLQILPNSNFDTILSPMQYVDTTNGSSFNLAPSRIKIRITYAASEPTFWNNYFYFLGTFSKGKMKEFVKIGGLKLAYILSSNYSGYYLNTQIILAIYKLERFLQNNADAGTYILDDDGSPMQLGDYAPVYY